MTIVAYITYLFSCMPIAPIGYNTHQKYTIGSTAYLIEFQLTLWYESIIASARYSHLANDNPAREILPSFVMYTCHLFVMLSL